MVWLRSLSLRHNKTLQYFDKYDYPLTKEEVKFWNSPVSPSSIPPLKLRGGKSGGVIFKDGFFFLRGRSNLIDLRKKREKYSLLKWGIAYAQATKLAKIPFIVAIFVTGSLAMSNCKKSDDIDLMIITSANTLWIVRLIVNLMFVRQRRFPGAKIAPDKICTNLWLDIRNLKIPVESLYHAHEVLQAKCIFDRGGIQYQFLKQNSWVREYLPNAYHRMNYELRSMKYAKKSIIRNSNFVIRILNGFMFGLQYLYMKPKMTTERIGLGYAFFHPGKVDNKSKLSIM